jgi:hypothetical protein
VTVAVLAVVVLVPAGCGDEGDEAPPADRGGGGGVICTEIGCSSGLYMDLGAIGRGLPGAQRVRLCVESACRSFPLGNAPVADMRVAGLKDRARVAVRMTVTGRDGRTLRRSSVVAPVRRTQPNGPECPPTCFQIAVRIDPGSLRIRTDA